MIAVQHITASLGTDQAAQSETTDTSELDLDTLDEIVGGLAKYYEMNGHWYIVGHDKHGKSTGAVRIT
ncbi:MAG: hypothetical protein K2X71_12435 [Methylobacterium sp.]|uniref:hypothetical protein n=1 Tax=Methylobacterium sp. TaxID=409 RepID=UPI00258A0627|nr:hypothetical protein [Methylobacterium sp.]MBY0296828.1 hypothetical protein [Methylobacterium sp.]